MALRIQLVILLLLLGRFAFAQSSLEGFSSGRYEVHKSTDTLKNLKRTPAADEEAATDDQATPATKAPVAATPKVVAPVAVAVPVPVVATSPAPVVPAKVEAVAAEPVQIKEPTIGEQAKELFSGNGPGKVFEFYKEQVHPDDIRNNKLEIEIAPALVYNDSQSTYTYRDYSSFFEAMKVDANVWVTPLIGLGGSMLFSLGADLPGIDSTKPRVTSKYENTDFALNFRNFFGISRLANSLEFSFLYRDQKMTVPSDNVSRARLETQGFGVALKTRMPTSQSYAWVVGGSFFPRAQHKETATGFDMTSGTVDSTSQIGLDLGGEWKFSREGQMTWNMGATIERNMFTDAAHSPDPSTGITPTNVSVTNSLYMFTLGYRWGH